MFLRYTAQEKDEYKSNIFPNLDRVNLSSASFKKAGTDTLSSFIFTVDDYNQNTEKFLIRDPSKNKNLLIKIFQISSPSMREELLAGNAKLVRINGIIKKYGVLQQDISAKNFSLETSDAPRLVYRCKFAFPEENLKFLSIGVVFYYDPLDILEEPNMELFDRSLIISSIKQIDIFDEEGANLLPGVVTDFRRIDDISSKNPFITKLEEVLVGDNFVKTANNSIAVPKSSPNFSLPYFSIDDSSNLKFIFNINYRKLLQENSLFKDVIKNTAFPEEILKNTQISSISIFRREYNYYNPSIGYARKEVKQNSTKKIIQSSQKTDSQIIQEQKDGLFKISELFLYKDLRSIQVVDREACKKPSFYSYGIRLTINDGTLFYIKNIKDTLLLKEPTLKQYFSETDKTVPLNVDLPLETQYYDPVSETFTAGFEKIYNLRYKTKIEEIISLFNLTLNAFGLVNKQESDENFKTFASMLLPTSANQRTILQFMDMYSKFILLLEKIIKQNKNNVIELEKWFDEILDTTIPNDFGYLYFNYNSNDGFMRITNRELQEKLQEQINVFADGAVPSNLENLKYSYISPSIVKTNIQQINLNTLNKYEDTDYVRMETNIRRFKKTGKPEVNITEQNKKFKNTFISQVANQSLFGSSVAITNFNIPVTNEILNNLNGAPISPPVDVEVDPTFMALSILKFSRKNTVQIPETNSREIDFDSIPFQMDGLFKNKTKIFDKILNYSFINAGYLKNLVQNSKYNLLFNTMQKIEFLKYDDNDVFKEKWTLLTKTEYDKLAENESVICRITPYQDSKLKLTSFQDISLPVYNKHFIFFKSVEPTRQNILNNFNRIIKDYRVSLSEYSKNIKNTKISDSSSTVKPPRQPLAFTSTAKQIQDNFANTFKPFK